MSLSALNNMSSLLVRLNLDKANLPALGLSQSSISGSTTAGPFLLLPIATTQAQIASVNLAFQNATPIGPQASNANLLSSLQNTKSDESQNVDASFASEIAHFTTLQTQLQAGSTVLPTSSQSSSTIALLLQHS